MEKKNEHKHLLIALPKNFEQRNFFKRKIQALVQTLGEFDVSMVRDEFRMGTDYFEPMAIKPSTVTLPQRTGLKSALKDFTHIVVFWDGEEFTGLIYFAMILKIPLRVIPVQITKVRNKDKNEAFDIYIGRGSPWGNPFPVGLGGTGDSREVVIEKYKTYFKNEFIDNPEKLRALRSLRGMRLGCHCKPLACHGDIIAKFLNAYDDSDDDQDVPHIN